MKITKTDYIYIFILLVLLILGTIYYYGSVFSINSDIGREFYIPWQINEGRILYKDIFNVYAPLGYQINAVILKLFSFKISAFYFMGAFSSFLSLLAVYFITKLYTDRVLAIIISVLVMVTCVFYPSISGYITPYSYSVLYAMTAFLLSFLMLIVYKKSDDIKYFILSCLFMGFSICCKYEYCLFFFILLCVGTYKKIGRKNALLSWGAFLFIPVVSFEILLVQGCTISDFVNSFNYMCKLASSESVKAFYSFSGFIPSIKFFMNAIKPSFIYPSMHFIFLGYITIFTLFVKKDKLQMLLNITAILVSLKCIGSLSLELYGTFFLPVLFINFAVFVYNYKKYRVIYTSFFILLFGLIYLYTNFDLISVKLNKQNVIKVSGYFNLYTNNNYFSERYSQIIKFINENTKETDKILVLPEGVILNYLTKRKSDNQFYYLIPPNVEIFTQEGIIQSLNKNLPDYVIVFYNKYPWYGTTSFSLGYAAKIQDFINNNYNVVESVSADYDKIYKVKERINE